MTEALARSGLSGPSTGATLFTPLRKSFLDLWSVPLAGGGTPRQVTDYPTRAGRLSPDGKLLAAGFYDTNAQEPWRLAIIPAAGEAHHDFGKPFIGLARWTADSQSVMYVISTTLTSGGSRPGRRTSQDGCPRAASSSTASPSRRQRAVILGAAAEADVLLIENIKKAEHPHNFEVMAVREWSSFVWRSQNL